MSDAASERRQATTPRARRILAASWLGLAFFAPYARAAAPVPPDLSAGQTYHLVFISTTLVDGSSPDATTYHQLVQAEADAAGLGQSEQLTWKAILSTPTTAANAGAVVGLNSPVFNMALARVADGRSSFYSVQHAAPINVSLSGAILPGLVWTGSTPAGLGDPGLTVGNNAVTPFATAGLASATDQSWIQFAAPASLSASLRLYALSQELTVPVPDADFNNDGAVDGADVVVWQRQLGTTLGEEDLAAWQAAFPSLPNSDFNADGAIDGADVVRWQRGLGTTYDAADLANWIAQFPPSSSRLAAAIPEPTPAYFTAVTAWTMASVTGWRRRLRR